MTCRGHTLAELLVATAVALVVVAASAVLIVRGRAAQAEVAQLARLEESGRAALDLLAEELLLAGYYGQPAPTAAIGGATPLGADEPTGLAVGGRCGASLAHDLGAAVHAANGAYAVTDAFALGCRAGPDGRVVAASDTLTVRHATAAPVSPAAGRLQVESLPGRGRLLADGTRLWPPDSVVHGLEVSVFYVSADATGRPGVPSLRRKRLVGGTTPAFQDEELVAGIEDLQVEFGVATRADGAPLVTGFVAPDAMPANAAVGAVRVWVLVRSEDRGRRQTTPPLRYADRDWPARSDHWRRRLLMRTVALRNAGDDS